MGQFMGWQSYDLNWFCPKCNVEYDPHYAFEHKDCKDEEDEEDEEEENE